MTLRSRYKAEACALINAIHRCHNPLHEAFKNYGGRGIEVCEEWRSHDGFERFIEHIGPRPSPTHSLERLDNSEGYRPGNVRWATRKDQQRNRRSARLTSEQLDAVYRISEETGLAVGTLRCRLLRGYSLSELAVPRMNPPGLPSPARRLAMDLRNAKIVERLEAGLTRKQIAAEFGLSKSYVGRIVARMSGHDRPR